jgi:hypothetical protein
MLTRVVEDHITNLGRTFRLFLDGFAHQMTSEVSDWPAIYRSCADMLQEIVLHTLHENGQIETQDLEAHIKDDIEREGGKIAEMTRKVRQAYKEVVRSVTPHDQSAALIVRLHLLSKTTCSSTRVVACSQSTCLSPQGGHPLTTQWKLCGRARRGLPWSSRAGYRQRVWPVFAVSTDRVVPWPAEASCQCRSSWVSLCSHNSPKMHADPIAARKCCRTIHLHRRSSHSTKTPCQRIYPRSCTPSSWRVSRPARDLQTTKGSIPHTLKFLLWVRLW